MRSLLCVTALATCLSSQALAVIDLQITETWSGNEPGENLTDDWFEVTNFGDMAWTPAAGDLYYDDDSQDPNAADLLAGIASIAPGESVIFVDGSATTGGLNVALWHGIWDDPITTATLSIPQVGTYEGSGMGQGGDGATLFFDTGLDGPDVGDHVSFAGYPDANLNGGQSYDAVEGAFTTAPFPGVVTENNDIGQPAIGTPGYVTPEPASLALFGLGASLACLVRRK